MRLQTLPNTAVGTHARSIDPALMLLTGVDASFDFDFNDYLHSASLCAAPRHRATLSKRSAPDLFHFRDGNFLTSSVIIVSSVSANSLRAHTQFAPQPARDQHRSPTGGKSRFNALGRTRFRFLAAAQQLNETLKMRRQEVLASKLATMRCLQRPFSQ